MELLKTTHIASAVIWLGNFVVTGVWSLRAFGSGRSELRAFAVREMLFTDIIFTLTFGTAVVVSGIVLALNQHIPLWTTAWTRSALVLVSGAGAVWLCVLLPLELKLHRLGDNSAAQTKRLFTVWNVVGWCLTLAIFAVLYIMVQKPT
ncbi:MAG: DUF2269 domain-containing protein [Candidatus Eremiobacteraeota bacterium]|nr:DUF2269 domain-containing protein [Candidatus Eremiobacteraeota bacterium]